MCLKGIESRTLHTKEIEALKTVPAAVPAAVRAAGWCGCTDTNAFCALGVVFPPMMKLITGNW